MKNVLLDNKIQATAGEQMKDATRRYGHLSPRDLLIVFLVILLANLAHHFLFQHVNATFAFDGKHYLDSCAMLARALIATIHGDMTTGIGILRGDEFSQSILFDGPMVVVLPALVFAAFQHVPVYADWRWLVTFYSLVQSITACVVSILAMKLTRDSRWAVSSGLLFGLYPPSLVNSGRFLSEVPTALYVAAFVLSISLIARSKKARIAAGFFGGLVALAKPALVPATILATMIAGWQSVPWPEDRQRQKWRLLKVAAVSISIFLSTALTILPWFAYTKWVTGKGSITAQRLPVYNVAVGTDRESDGWCTLPDSPYVKLMITDETPLSVLISQWSNDPRGCASLCVKRITRMFAYPYNNFREFVFGLSPEAQQNLHAIFMLLASLGLSAYILQRSGQLWRRQSARADTVYGDMCVLLLAAHFTYCSFQAMARYAYSSVPILCVFAVFGLKCLADWSNRAGAKSTASPNPLLVQGQPSLAPALPAIIFCIMLSSLVFFGEQWASKGNGTETVHHVQAGQSLEKEIDLSTVRVPTSVRTVFLLVDGEKDLEQARVNINGHLLTESLLPFDIYDSCLYGNYALMSEFAHLLDRMPDDFRQWRALIVPPEWINLRGTNKVSITLPESTTNSSLTIYGAARREKRRIPSPYFFAYEQLIVPMDKLEPRVVQSLCNPGAEHSAFISDKAGQRQEISDVLNIKLALLPSDSAVLPSASSEAGLAKASSSEAMQLIEVSPEAFPIFARDPNKNAIVTNSYVLKAWGAASAVVKLKPARAHSHMKLHLTGQLRVLGGPGKAGLVISVRGRNGVQIIAGRCPDYIRGRRGEWIDFSINDIVPMLSCGGSADSVELLLYPCPAKDAMYNDPRACSAVQLRNLKLQVQAIDSLDVQGRRLLLF